MMKFLIILVIISGTLHMNLQSQYKQLCNDVLDYKYIKKESTYFLFGVHDKKDFRFTFIDSCSNNDCSGIYYKFNDSTAIIIMYENYIENQVNYFLHDTVLFEKVIFIKYQERATFFVISKTYNSIYIGCPIWNECVDCFKDENKITYKCKYYDIRKNIYYYENIQDLTEALDFITVKCCELPDIKGE